MEINAAQVKSLRDKTGAGFMDCKRALAETGGDEEKSLDLLRKMGIASAANKSSRSANDGVIYSYIHPGSKIGVLLEVNCETDFVAKTDNFQSLVKDVAMHIAATDPLVANRDEMPADALDKEREFLVQQAKESGKPEAVIEKMVEGRLDKFFAEKVLLEQPFVKDPKKTVGDLVTEAVATLGENIVVRRFSRFQLGN